MELHYLAKDPIQQFHDWFKAVETSLNHPNAMSLATVGKDGSPSLRIVLLKGANHDGFTFFTNYESKKGQDLAENSKAALCFYWDSSKRQIRIEGIVEKTSREETQRYFESRPRGSQIGAWTSPQSQEIPSREFLMKRQEQFEIKFKDIITIPAPEHWGGYLLRPERMEFWQEQANRLHDRFLYTKVKDSWTIKRIAP